MSETVEKQWVPFDPATDVPPQSRLTMVDVLFASGASWQGFDAVQAGNINWKGYGEGNAANVVAYRISLVPRWRILVDKKDAIEREIRKLNDFITTPNRPPSIPTEKDTR